MLNVNGPDLGPLEEAYVLDALRSGWITSGPYLDRFERDFAAWVGSRHAVAVCSGTAALWAALMALDLPAGQPILMPAFACDALANAALVAGHRPLVLDVEGLTWGLSYEQVAAGVFPEPAALILVHTYGVPALDTEPIVDWCRDHRVPMIEDASEAHGAAIDGRRVGGFGDFGVFSCRGEKTLGAGQFGAVVTDSDDLARRVRLAVDNGLPSPAVRYWSVAPSLNLRPPHLSAALACAQLERADELVAARRAVHARWRTLLAGLPFVFQQPHGDPVWWLTAVDIARATGMLPQDLITALHARGIEGRPGFYPLGSLPHVGGGPAPVARRLLETLLVLPSGPQITEAEQRQVVQALTEILGLRMTGGM